MLVVAALGASSAWAAESIRGVITGRGDSGTVIVQTDSARVTVAMSDTTRINRIDGIRPVLVSSADLVPGLRIKASGEFESPDRFTATKITFSREDFKIAAAIQAGVMPTDQRSLVNERAIGQHSQELASQQQTLTQHGQELQTQSGQISANEQKIAATSGALNARISNLDDYAALKTITVYFKNNKYDLSDSDKALLQQFAAEARGTSSYMVQVQAYASAVGSYQLNQRLTLQRADRVTQLLQQNGVPLTNIFVPGAMGTTDQVATNKTAQGQAENRRAIVTLLQNKGLAGK
ncbi:MAG TPA: OmpA family protein [Vicinamibacterales bacterium]|nr:OmpA family protein [Vicinamibacterales bacterium]